MGVFYNFTGVYNRSPLASLLSFHLNFGNLCMATLQGMFYTTQLYIYACNITSYKLLMNAQRHSIQEWSTYVAIATKLESSVEEKIIEL